MSHRHLAVPRVLFALATLCAPAAVPISAQVIVGRVVDAASGEGVARARVAAIPADHGWLVQAMTGPDGRFSIVLTAGGPYRVEVAREGVRRTRTRPVTVGPADTVEVNVRVAAAPVRLDALAVTARPRRLPVVVGSFVETALTPAAARAGVTASGGRRKVVLRGRMAAPTYCQRLGGAAERRRDTVTVIVEARETERPCPGSVGAFSYEVSVRGLRAGTYTMRVLNAYRGDAWPMQVVLDTTVTVR
jgi:hypothetical protein